jgi:hypothetical protein
VAVTRHSPNKFFRLFDEYLYSRSSGEVIVHVFLFLSCHHGACTVEELTVLHRVDCS